MKTRARRLHKKAALILRKTARVFSTGKNAPAKGLYLVKDALGKSAFRAYKFVFGKRMKTEGG